MNRIITTLLMLFFSTSLHGTSSKPVDPRSAAAIEYLLSEQALDSQLTPLQQQEKIGEFEQFSESLPIEIKGQVIQILLERTFNSAVDLLVGAELSDQELNMRVTDLSQGIFNQRKPTVESARQMLFFVEELKQHRHLVYQFGMAIGVPRSQLLRHDLSKLTSHQLEPYARFIRGGKKEADLPAFLKAWERHQYEEHHLERYSKEGFAPSTLPEERLRNNMRETVADLLAATKQRGGTTVVDWLLTALPEKHPHPDLLPFLEEALKEAHTRYLLAEENPDQESPLRGFPCWSDPVESLFDQLTAESK